MRAVFALLIASAAAAQTEHITAARQRQEAVMSTEVLLRLTSDNEVGTVRMVFDGTKAREDRDLRSTLFLESHHWTSATDGLRVKSYTLRQGRDSLGYWSGLVNTGATGVCRGVYFLPVSFAARGLHHDYCPFPADTLTRTGTAEIRERECQQFTSGTATLWLDPAAGFTLRRYSQGGTVIDVESSDANPAKVWLPSSYTMEKRDASGRVTERHEYTVERVEVGKRYPDAEFDPPWPAGVRVHDVPAGREFVSDDTGTLQPAHTIDVVQDWFVRLWWVPVAAVAVGGGLLGWRLWKVNRGCQPAGGSPPRPPHP